MLLLLGMFLVLLLIFIIEVHIYKEDVVSPSIIFTLAFIFSSIWALSYSRIWELNLHVNTFIVIVSGVSIFFIITVIIRIICNSIMKNETIISEYNSYEGKIGGGVLLFIIVYEILAMYVILKSVITVVGGNWMTLSDTIFRYRQAMATTNPYELPSVASTMMVTIIALGYWLGYILIKELVIDKQLNKELLVATVLAIVTESVTGSRGASINTILAIIMFYILFYTKIRGTINFKIIKKISVYVMTIVIIFLVLGSLIGRQVADGMTMVDYLAEYFGAEIKNLDTFLQGFTVHNDVFGGQTFYSIVKNKIPGYALVLPFQKIGNFSLGNVYTTFYPYIYDFGYVGIPILVTIMAVVSQLFFELAKREKISQVPGIMTLIYGYIFPTIVQVFFSNKFYEDLLDIKFIKICILWILYNIILIVYLYLSRNIKIQWKGKNS
ncbi:O-antigen polymerase [Ligilactobacillus salivarius]|uniref:O-antigen polymerase n=1 Tax=Ligilactobacillus salivarius TaxID=1624 RepID=UPI0024BBA058|nr:O-antigen polymerase [Ligilactobacillus salivarius]